MACDVQELLDDAPCFSCLAPGDLDLIELALLCAIANNETVACDPQSLLDEAACYSCLPQGTLQLLKIQLLCQIMQGGGGGGGAQEVYIDRDPLPPDDPTKPALNYPAGGGSTTQWDVASQSWL